MTVPVITPGSPGSFGTCVPANEIAQQRINTGVKRLVRIRKSFVMPAVSRFPAEQSTAPPDVQVVSDHAREDNCPRKQALIMSSGSSKLSPQPRLFDNFEDLS